MPLYTVRRRTSYYQDLVVEADNVTSALAQAEEDGAWQDTDWFDENVETQRVVCACGQAAGENGRCNDCVAEAANDKQA